MANTEWWQRGPIDGIPGVLQPIAHILLQVRESVGEVVAPLTEDEWNARPGGVAAAAFHVRHIAGVIDRLFTYARGHALTAEQLAAIQSEGQELLTADVATVLGALSTRVDAAVAELRTIDVATLSDFRGVGRAQLPSTVIGCLVHGAEHAMRHAGQLSVTARLVLSKRAIPTLYEWLGGIEALNRLTTRFYEHVGHDALLSPVFAHMGAEHPAHVAAFLGEVLGGPATYSESHGGHPHMIRRHLERRLSQEQRRRWVTLLLETADELNLPDDPEFRSALVGYLEWGSRLAVINSQPGATVNEHAPMPQWGWGEVKGPYKG